MSKAMAAYQSQATLYFVVADPVTGGFWNNASGAFQAQVSGNMVNYANSYLEQGLTGIYEGIFPGAIPPGVYNIAGKRQVGGTVLDTDPAIGGETFQWDGSNMFPLSNLTTSGQLSLLTPIKIYRGEMVTNFPFKMVSAADHVTAFTSGVISGQISRDGAAFTALQSGAFLEMGLGWYRGTLTSGDLLANTVALVFTGAGISGGLSDQRDFGFILQKSSGSV